MEPDSNRAERRQHFDLNALYESSRLFNASLDLDVVINNLMLMAMTKLMVTRGLVLLYDPVRQGYVLRNVKGIRDVEVEDFWAMAPLETVCTEADVPALLAEHGLVLALPISAQTRHLGVVAFGKKATQQPFADEELAFIESLVNMSSTAVHNALMVTELRQANQDLDRKIQELNTLFDISKEFNATFDQEHLLKLLSFATMGQLALGKYLFLLRLPNAESGAPLHVAANKGLDLNVVDEALLVRLGEVDELIQLSDHDPNKRPWKQLHTLNLQIVLPLKAQGKTEGVLCLGPKLTGASYTPGDIEFLFALGNLFLTSMQNAYLIEDQIARKQLEEEMRLARDIQKRLLPQDIPTFTGFELAAIAQPSREVGGDYFDLIPLDDDRLLVAIADVTGKGMPAALLMANLQACLRVILLREPDELDLCEASSRINHVIHANTGYDRFITFFWGIFDRRDYTFTYVNAGHDPPIYLTKDQEVKRLEKGGLLFGIFAMSSYESDTIQMRPSEVLTLFTDGVTEAMNPDNEEYTEARLLTCLETHRAHSASKILNHIRDDINAFTCGAPQSDDITMMVLKAN